MSDLPWFRMTPSRWLTDIRWMPPTTAHAYMTMTLLALDREGPIPDDPARLARYANMSVPAFKKALESLLEAGTVWRTDDGLMTDFVNEEVAFRDEKRAKSKTAAHTRWTKKQGKSTDAGCARNAGAMPEEEEYIPTVREDGERAKARDPSSPSSTSQKGMNGIRSPSGEHPVHHRGQEIETADGRVEITAVERDRLRIRHINTGNTGSIRVDAGRLAPAINWDLDDEIPF